MAEFRAVPATDRPRVREILRYAFEPHRGPVTEPADGERPPTLFDERGLYDGGRLVGTCKLYYLDSRIRGERHRIGGLGAVAIPPEDRDNGYSRQLCRNALAEYERNGVGVVALWPFSTSFYRNLGWGAAHRIRRYEFPPELLPAYDVPGRMLRLDGDDWERLRAAESASAVGLSLRRSEQWWRERTLAEWAGRGEPYLYGYEREGTVEGYLVYTVDDGGETTLSVTHMAATDEAAHRALLDFLRGHGAQIERIELSRGVDSPFLERVPRPERIDCRVEPGPMARLTSVETLESVSWPATDIDCTMRVTDPLLEWNDTEFSFSVVDGDATVERTAGSDPDLSVGISTLSRLAIGGVSTGTAARLGGLDIRTGSLRAPLEELFTPQQVRLQEFF